MKRTDEATPTASGNAALPKITVVTVARNIVDVIERTLKSVVEQDYENLEYIIVDGGSTDGTIDVVRSYHGGLTRWISGADDGPYDAMNKGASLASGQWILFMNGGDRFADARAVSRVFADDRWRDADVVYGDGIYTGADGSSHVERATDPLTLTDGNGFSHQSAFVRTELQTQFGFDKSERIAADYDLFLRLFKARKKFVHVDVVVSEFFLGGLSSVPRAAGIRLRHRVYKKHFPRSELVLHGRLAAVVLKTMARSALPERVWASLKRGLQRGTIAQVDRR